MKPEVKKYLNAIQFLQDVYQFHKENDPQFSYDVWAKELGLNDKSYVRILVLGKRPLNPKILAIFAENLNLPPVEKEYFINLVHYTQSKTQAHKELFGKKLVQILKTELDQLEIESHFDFLSNPLLPRLQVLLSFTDLEQSPKNLAWLLSCFTDEVIAALEKLESLQLIRKEGLRYVTLKKSFKVADNFGDIGMNAFYMNSLDEAKKALLLPKEVRRVKSLFLPLTAQEFTEFLSNMQNFVNEQLFKFNPDKYKGRRLYQVHMNIIPVANEEMGGISKDD
ncbi:TIGR02147 family protein [Bdellovibrio sp. 22V]|nr:TIGR02147 family protein [Bdellovibrio sp. 22V]WII73889.1 TIGR02147 family protein [Bdellovibrio sp. 22V]